MRSSRYEPTPFFLDPDGFLWQIPYAYCLHHTVEEIYKKCLGHSHDAHIYVDTIRTRLGLDPTPVLASLEKISVEEFMDKALKAHAFVFIALHGGSGENGTWQKMLDLAGLPYNGSGEKASHLCMDKLETGNVINHIADPALIALPKYVLHASTFKNPTPEKIASYWAALQNHLGLPPYIIKPQHDGCSSGIVPLESSEDLTTYMNLVHKGASCIPIHSFKGQESIIELSSTASQSAYVLEPFLQTDGLTVSGCTLVHTPRSGWMEITIAVFESHGAYHALNPSLTVSSNQVLNVEEKFQGGTGTNITPPPPP